MTWPGCRRGRWPNWPPRWRKKSATARAQPAANCWPTSGKCRPRPVRRKRTMTTKHDDKDTSANMLGTVVIAAGVVTVLMVHWLSRLDDLQLAGLGIGAAVVGFACWAV